MLNSIAILLVCQLAGEIVSQFLGISVPGPVLGMVLLFATLRYAPKVAGMLRETSDTILRHLSLLFVPAGVGVMLHARTVADEWLAIAVSLLLGTIITLIVTAITIRLVMRLVNIRPESDR